MDHSADFVAGCLAGVAGVFVGHPFDTVKVRLQGQSSKNPLYRNALDCFRTTIRKEGPKGLYKGVSSPLYSLTLINAVVFGVQGNILRRMDDSLTSHFLAGTAAGLSQCWITSPMELVKIRMQSQGEGERHINKKVYTSALDCGRKIYQAEGIRGIYRGLTATTLRELPAFGVYFATYEYLCRLFSPNGSKDSPTYVLLMAGGVAGCSSWFSNYPIDVLKTRIQKDGLYVDGKFHYKYSGYIDCIRHSVAQDGYSVFFRGLSPTLTRAFVTNAATFPVYTLCIRYMRPNDGEAEHREGLERCTMIAQHQS
ncbi:mitochondrial basic amino acids transporter-like [Watersipora subatra]|uniref:mitochondrial basic amino acids transporter-like n=1 Tax=Watersipora subatra TaxID=2589382 RepID=UPI00355B114A